MSQRIQAAAKNDRERQMTGFIADDNQAALNGTKKRRKGGLLRHSSAGSVSGIINILRALSTAECVADELAVARKEVESQRKAARRLAEAEAIEPMGGSHEGGGEFQSGEAHQEDQGWIDVAC